MSVPENFPTYSRTPATPQKAVHRQIYMLANSEQSKF